MTHDPEKITEINSVLSALTPRFCDVPHSWNQFLLHNHIYQRGLRLNADFRLTDEVGTYSNSFSHCSIHGNPLHSTEEYVCKRILMSLFMTHFPEESGSLFPFLPWFKYTAFLAVCNMFRRKTGFFQREYFRLKKLFTLVCSILRYMISPVGIWNFKQVSHQMTHRFKKIPETHFRPYPSSHLHYTALRMICNVFQREMYSLRRKSYFSVEYTRQFNLLIYQVDSLPMNPCQKVLPPFSRKSKGKNSLL